MELGCLLEPRIQEGGAWGRKWESEEGNLFLSIITRIQNKPSWSWVPLISSMAVVEAIKQLLPELEVRIKWPNDLYLNHLKLGGILCEGTSKQSDSFIVVGIGLNCLNSPGNITQGTTHLHLSDLHELRILIISSVLKELAAFVEKGPEIFLDRFEAWAEFKKGTAVQWGSLAQTGTIEGLGRSGELVVVNYEGNRIQLFAEDVNAKIIPLGL